MSTRHYVFDNSDLLEHPHYWGICVFQASHPVCLKRGGVAILGHVKSFSDNVRIAHDCPKRRNIGMVPPLGFLQIFHGISITSEGLVIIVLLHVHGATILQRSRKTDLALALMHAMACSFCPLFPVILRQEESVYSQRLRIQLQRTIDIIPSSLQSRRHIHQHIRNTDVIAADGLAPAKKRVLVACHGIVKITIEIVEPTQRMQRREYSGMAIRTTVSVSPSIEISMPLRKDSQRLFAVLDGIIKLTSPPVQRR